MINQRIAVVAASAARVWGLRQLHCSPLACKIIDVVVPQLAESITNGDVASIVAEGEQVPKDSVVATIEMDKGAAEVYTYEAGQVVKVCVGVEDEVEVGQLLLKIDTDLASAAAPDGSSAADQASQSTPAPAPSPAPPAPAKPAPAASAPAPAPAQAAASGGAGSKVHRMPMIRFRHGKRDVIDREMGLVVDSSSLSSSFDEASSPLAPNDPGFVDEPPMFARTPITDAEMEAVLLGGASDAY